MVMKTIILSLLLILSATSLQSQEIDIQAGIRSGYSNGLSCRVLTGTGQWTEAMLLGRDRGVQLYLFFGKSAELPRFGAHGFGFSTAWGIHVGSAGRNYRPYRAYSNERGLLPVAGVDFLASLDFRLKKFPLIISADYKPFAEIIPDRFFRVNLWDFGISLRYQFTTKI